VSTKRAVTAGLSLLLLAGGLLSVGCGKKDDTYTAAPPAGPSAKPMPRVERAVPRPKLPKLVDPSGKRAAGADI
jgi:hypothetical protein